MSPNSHSTAVSYIWAGTVFRAPDPFVAELHLEVTRQDRGPLWGAGFRATRGRWGFETQYMRVTGVFQPGSLFGESPFEPLRALAPREEPESLLIAQGIFRPRSGVAAPNSSLDSGPVLSGYRHWTRAGRTGSCFPISSPATGRRACSRVFRAVLRSTKSRPADPRSWSRHPRESP